MRWISNCGASQVKQLLLDGSTASRAQLLAFLPSLTGLQSLCVVSIDKAGRAGLTQAFKEGLPSLVKLTCADTHYLPDTLPASLTALDLSLGTCTESAAWRSLARSLPGLPLLQEMALSVFGHDPGFAAGQLELTASARLYQLLDSIAAFPSLKKLTLCQHLEPGDWQGACARSVASPEDPLQFFEQVEDVLAKRLHASDLQRCFPELPSLHLDLRLPVHCPVISGLTAEIFGPEAASESEGSASAWEAPPCGWGFLADFKIFKVGNQKELFYTKQSFRAMRA